MLKKTKPERTSVMIVKTYCARMDHGGCGILAHVENGKITRIEGDPDSPLNRGTICAKGIAQIERLNHPDRLIYSDEKNRRKGRRKMEAHLLGRGSGYRCGKMRETIQTEGERAVSFCPGNPKGS